MAELDREPSYDQLASLLAGTRPQAALTHCSVCRKPTVYLPSQERQGAPLTCGRLTCGRVTKESWSA